MNTVTEITFFILGALVAMIVLFAIGGFILSLIDDIFQRHFEKGQQAQWEKDRRSLMDKAMWFSEDEATRKLIEALAQDGSDISRARDAWREMRSKP